MENLPATRDSFDQLRKAFIEGEMRRLEDQFASTALDVLKAKSGGPGRGVAGSRVPQVPGYTEPSSEVWAGAMGDFAGLREKPTYIRSEILREIAQKCVVIAAVHNARCRQLRPFTMRSDNEDRPGFKVKLRDEERHPNKKDDKITREIEDFFFNTGRTDFDGAEEREDRLPDVVEKIAREALTLDQVAISLRRNAAGELLDFWVLDAGTITRTFKDVGYDGNKKVAFVQKYRGKVVEQFERGELIFDSMNKGADINRNGYGISLEEMALEVITSFLFAMGYNKEQFNTGTQPVGAWIFKGANLNQIDLENLQREWINMFRGVKGMWKTPFLQHDARWQPIRTPNKDMEFNQYLQMLAGWICAVYGIDPAELGFRFNQSSPVMNENIESKVSYSQDRGLKDLLFFVAKVMNKIMESVPRWKDYTLTFTGLESRNQKTELEIDQLRVQNFLTLNELRAEKDLPPVENGDVLLNPSWLTYVTQKAMNEPPTAGEVEGGGAPDADAIGAEMGPEDAAAMQAASPEQIDQATDEAMETRKGGKPPRFGKSLRREPAIEIIL